MPKKTMQARPATSGNTEAELLADVEFAVTRAYANSGSSKKLEELLVTLLGASILVPGFPEVSEMRAEELSQMLIEAVRTASRLASC